jgi:hypothetical protein
MTNEPSLRGPQRTRTGSEWWPLGGPTPTARRRDRPAGWRVMAARRRAVGGQARARSRTPAGTRIEPVLVAISSLRPPRAQPVSRADWELASRGRDQSSVPRTAPSSTRTQPASLLHSMPAGTQAHLEVRGEPVRRCSMSRSRRAASAQARRPAGSAGRPPSSRHRPHSRALAAEPERPPDATSATLASIGQNEHHGARPSGRAATVRPPRRRGRPQRRRRRCRRRRQGHRLGRRRLRSRPARPIHPRAGAPVARCRHRASDAEPPVRVHVVRAASGWCGSRWRAPPFEMWYCEILISEVITTALIYVAVLLVARS